MDRAVLLRQPALGLTPGRHIEACPDPDGRDTVCAALRPRRRCEAATAIHTVDMHLAGMGQQNALLLATVIDIAWRSSEPLHRHWRCGRSEPAGPGARPASGFTTVR